MTQLGRYEIIDTLGTGSMGTVYRARDTALDREVALKTMRTSMDADPLVRERFYREARACARLQHPNIITVYDLGEVDGTAYIAMELLRGWDFRRIIQDRTPVGVEVKIAAIAEVCDAIAEAHRHGVIHRDIKPSNLFLTEAHRAKVLDFGIARLPSSKLTMAGQILGTPNYMAPEQILGRPSDGRADLFSVAVVFFELLTFTHPFQSNLIPRRIVQGEPDSLFDHDSTLPVLLERVIARSLAKDPDRRYQTGDEFAADLRAVLNALGGSASAAPVELPSQHAVHVAAPHVEPAAVVDVPEGQDPDEWRLSEALRLLPEFEAAIDRRDFNRAQATAAELEKRLAGDIRFAEAMSLCRSRLEALRPAQPVAMPPPPARERPPVREEPAPQSRPRGGAADIDATIFTTAPKAPPEPRPAPIARQASSAPTGYAPPARARVPEKPPTPPPAVRSGPPAAARRKRLIIIAVGIGVCAVLLLGAALIAFRPVPIEPAVATAQVGPATAFIYAGPGAGESTITAAAPGTELNVLRLPLSRDQEWTSVQIVKPKVLRPGYAHTAELENWRGNTAASALALVRNMGAGESGTEEEIEKQIGQLRDVVSRFGNDSAAQDAQSDIARLTAVLAQRRQAEQQAAPPPRPPRFPSGPARRKR